MNARILLTPALLFTLLLGNSRTLSAGTVAFYRFDEGPAGANVSSIVDSGPNHLNGSPAGSNPLKYETADSMTASRFALDASGDLNFGRVPHNAAMALQQSWTVEVFVKPHLPHGSFGGTTGDPTHYSIVTKQNNAGFGGYLAAWSLAFEPNNGRVLGYIGFGNDAGLMLESTNSIADGKWHHLALVLGRNFRGSLDRLLLYVDGVRVAQLNQDMPDLFYGTEALLIGAGNFGNDPSGTEQFRRNFDGAIDEIRISDAELAPAQFLPAGPVIVTPPQPFSLGILQTSPTNMRISWPSESNRSYQLQRSTIAGSGWENAGNSVIGNGTAQSLDLQVDNTRRFYRMMVPY